MSQDTLGLLFIVVSLGAMLRFYGRHLRSPAAMEKSWFSRKIWTNRSNVLPETLLVGLEVRAVACAAATDAEAVAVYMVGPVAAMD